jgi:hypothetical protein
MAEKKETTAEETTVEETVKSEETTVEETTVEETVPYVAEIIDGLSLQRESLEKFLKGNKKQAYKENQATVDAEVKREIKGMLMGFGCPTKSKAADCSEAFLSHFDTLTDAKQKILTDVFVQVSRDAINPFVTPVPVSLDWKHYFEKRHDTTERLRNGEVIEAKVKIQETVKLVKDKETGLEEIKTVYRAYLLS